jgi:hypothetical protein
MSHTLELSAVMNLVQPGRVHGFWLAISASRLMRWLQPAQRPLPPFGPTGWSQSRHF